MSYFQVYDYEDDEAMLRRAVEVIKQATEIQADPELMAKISEELEKEHDCIVAAMDGIPEMVESAEKPESLYKEDDLDPDDPDTRVSKFLKRLAIDREEEAEKTNETPSERRRRLGKRQKKTYLFSR